MEPPPVGGGGEGDQARGRPRAALSQGSGTACWRVEQSYAGLGLVSPSGTLVTWYWEHERKRAEADARRLNGQPSSTGSG
jgi:hypothetical protein